MSAWFASSWSTVGFVALSTLAMYASLLIGIRVAGRRTLAQLSAFDAVITIALGSMMATTVLSPSPTFVQGVTAVSTLLVLQVGLGVLRRRVGWVRRAVEFEPVVLVEHGSQRDRSGVLGSQITEDELRSALRTRGIFDLADVELCILEPTGEISALRVRSDAGHGTPSDDQRVTRGDDRPGQR